MFRSLMIAVILASSLLVQNATAAPGLVIHAAEWGVGKFHRKDNLIHAYDNNSAWSVFILQNGSQMGNAPAIQKNTDNSYTVFFSSLDELLSTVESLSKQQGQQVQVLNIHGHGLPGAMWFPKDQQTMNSMECYSWVSAARGSDNTNYTQYYSAVSASDIKNIRQMSQSTNSSYGCTTGLAQWKAIVAKHPNFKSTLSSDIKIHFLSCVVGLGKAGETFAQGLANMLFDNNTNAEIETSVNFGLGDWSMPAGMGFWDYVTDEQLAHDNQIYPINRRDSEVAQKGSIRKTQLGVNGATSMFYNDQSAMPLDQQELSGPTSNAYLDASYAADIQNSLFLPMPSRVRIPGTNFETTVVYY